MFSTYITEEVKGQTPEFFCQIQKQRGKLMVLCDNIINYIVPMFIPEALLEAS